MSLASNSLPAADTGVSAETLNVLTHAARTTPAMVQPVAVAPDPLKTPRYLANQQVTDAAVKLCASYVRAFSRALNTADKAQQTAGQLTLAFVARVFDAKPSYTAYMQVRDELHAACTLQGFIDLQFDTIRKAYAYAVKTTFGEIPVSDSAAAQAKAKARAKKAQDKASKGGKKGKPEVQPVAEHEVIGQCIAKYGAAAVLVELSKILATEKATVQDAHTLMDVAKHYAK